MIVLVGAGAASASNVLAAPITPPAAPIVRSDRLNDLSQTAPAGVADLRAIQDQVLKIVDAVRQSTVGIIVGDSQGSGVIVSEDGLVLTAGHVILTPGRKVAVVLADGRRVAGRALGLNNASDCGLVRITEPGPFPASKISDMTTLKVGDWCVATGHPGGQQPGRAPVVRLGRLVAIHQALLQTDCPLLGGDSGGPLFDLRGNVIGVHSRIGPRASLNLHVSAGLFIRDWDRLVKSPDEGPADALAQGMLGVNGRNDSRGALITAVFPGLPAMDAGIKTGDIVAAFSGHHVDGFDTLQKFVKARKPGEIVELKVLRGTEVRELRATLVARPGQ